jgi:hypothetical protein
LYLVLIADTSVMPGALDSRVVKFGTFLAILFAANFLADYYVLFGGLDDECYELQRERIHRSLLSGALSTCVFPMSWMAVGSLLEAYL